MEFLIQQKVPQRTAHAVIGRLVGQCEGRGLKRLADLSDADFLAAHPALGREPASGWALPAVQAFQSYGSTAPEQVEAQLQRWKNKLELEPQPGESPWPQ